MASLPVIVVRPDTDAWFRLRRAQESAGDGAAFVLPDEVVAALGLPLGSVGVGQVFSRYIGETEKNIARMLANAEQRRVLVLFDEADALFGMRGAGSADRAADMQGWYPLTSIDLAQAVPRIVRRNRGHLRAQRIPDRD
jgi:hypothetical protein